MRSRAQITNSLRPVSLNQQNCHSRPTTAAFFFEQPKSKRTLSRLVTEPCSSKNCFKKSKLCRVSSKFSPNYRLKNRQKRLSCVQKNQNNSSLDLGPIFDWNYQGRQKQPKLKQTNTRIGSILRGIRTEIAEKLMFRQLRGIHNVAILGTKLL